VHASFLQKPGKQIYDLLDISIIEIYSS